MKKNYFTPELSLISVEDTIRTSGNVPFTWTEEGSGHDLDWGVAISK